MLNEKMNEPYQFKTDRSVQWNKLEAHSKAEGRPKKLIEIDKAFFFDGPDEERQQQGKPSTYYLSHLPDRGFEGWQRFIDKYCTEPLNDADVFNFQAGILRGFSGYFQHPEDDAYYVRSLWGNRWSPGIKMKLRINSDSPVPPLDANLVYICAGSNLTSWLKQVEGESSRGGYLRFMPDFFEKVPAYIDSRVFDLNTYRREVVSPEIPVRISTMKAITRSIIIYAHKIPTGVPYDDERVSIANRFLEMFQGAVSESANLDLFIEKTLEEDN